MELNLESNRLEKYNVIEHELQRAKRIHPDYPDNFFKQLIIIQEEFGEAKRAVIHFLNKNGSMERVKTKLVQTAAMCVRMLENLKTDEKYVEEQMTDTYLPEQDMKDSD